MPNTVKPIEIKIATVVAVNAILHSLDPAVLDQAMREMTGGDAEFFDGELTILDIGALDTPGAAIEWAGLITLFRTYGLNPVAVRNAPAAMHAQIQAHGLSLDEAPANQHAAQEAAAQQAAQEAAVQEARDSAVREALEQLALQQQAQQATAQTQPATAAATMIIDTPVRAGQRIYARGADLVITAAVNNGAEVIADGSIHIYAPLRGRALAGASGHTEARIFSLSMEPELVSIAGVYRTFENGFPPELAGHAAQVKLDGERLEMVPVKAGH